MMVFASRLTMSFDMAIEIIASLLTSRSSWSRTRRRFCVSQAKVRSMSQPTRGAAPCRRRTN